MASVEAPKTNESNDALRKSTEAIETDESSDELNIPEYLDMEKEQWYHGCLPFEDIVGLLKKNGDFLIRELEPEGDRIAAAST